MERRDPIPVSVIVMTKEEERNIAKCLRSLEAFGEVCVVDSASRDRTCAIAASMGARVIPFRWNGEYPKKKQWCLENVGLEHDWVLYVDADEEVPAALEEEIRALMLTGASHAGYFAGYDYVFMDRVLRHGHRVYKLVLFDRRRGRFVRQEDLEVTNAGEVELHYQPHIDGRVGRLRNRMLHNDHETLFHFFERHNRYSDWEAFVRERGTLLAHGGAEVGQRAAVKRLFAALPFKGLVAFLHSFVLRAGFRDGAPGFHYALARAFYYWQIGIKRRDVAGTASPSAGGATTRSALCRSTSHDEESRGRGSAVPVRTVSSDE